MRMFIAWKGSDKNAASASDMTGFETALLTQKDYLRGLGRFRTAESRMGETCCSQKQPITVSTWTSTAWRVQPVTGMKNQLTIAILSVFVIIRCFASTSTETVSERCSDRATLTVWMSVRNASSLLLTDT